MRTDASDLHHDIARRGSLRRELFAAFFLAAGVALLLVAAVRIYLFLDATAKARQTRVAESAESVARLVEAYLGERRRLLIDFAAHVEAVDADPARVADRIAILRAQDPALSSLVLRRSDGALAIPLTEVAQAGAAGGLPGGDEQREAGARAQASGHSEISAVFVDPALAPGPVVTLSVPWQERGAPVAGVAEGTFDLARLRRLTILLSRLPESETWIVDRDGRLLWNGPARRDPALSPVVLEAAGARLAEEPPQRHLVGRSAVFGAGWSAIVQQPRRALWHAVWPQVWVTLAWTVIALGVAALLAGLSVRRITRPLERLAAGIRGLELGEGDVTALELSPDSPREFEVVSRAARELGARLERTFAGLSRVLAEREATIQRRTSQLRASEERARTLVEESLAFVCTHSLDGVLLTVNAAASAALGIPGQALVGSSLRDIVPDHLHERVDSYLGEIAREGTHDGLLEVRNAAHEKLVWRYHNRLLEMAGEKIVIAVAVDVTEQKRAEAELARRADLDSLTGLGNRGLLARRIEAARLQASRHGRRFGLVCLDLDRFKPINDRYGHSAGDRVLVEVAERLRSRVRGTDTVARLGGDEFAVLLFEVEDRARAERVGRILGDLIAEPIGWEECALTISASVGVAVYPEDGEDAEALLRQADLRMYGQKPRG